MIDKIIKDRRAIPPRFMLKDEIPKEIILQLLENANWAPTHKNTEPWRFKIFTGTAKQKFAEDGYQLLVQKIEQGLGINPQKVEKFKENLERVPVAICIIFERDIAERVQEWEEIAAVSMAVQNMWLTATDLGLGGFWSTPEFMPYLHDLLALKPNQKLLGLFFVGKIAMELPGTGRGDIAEKIEWIG
jgi:nitroreductase